MADPPEVTAADFWPVRRVRALALTRRQSKPLSATTNPDDALAAARAELDADPGLVPDEWVSYAVRPERVEFWQGETERRHQRLRCTAADPRWARTQLWP